MIRVHRGYIILRPHVTGCLYTSFNATFKMGVVNFIVVKYQLKESGKP